jgi:hypothetical protein
MNNGVDRFVLLRRDIGGKCRIAAVMPKANLDVKPPKFRSNSGGCRLRVRENLDLCVLQAFLVASIGGQWCIRLGTIVHNNRQRDCRHDRNQTYPQCDAPQTSHGSGSLCAFSANIYERLKLFDTLKNCLDVAHKLES